MTALLAVRILEGATAEFGVTGRAFVAAGVRAGGSLALDEPWDAALGAGVDAHWTRLPELGAYVREKARAVRMLVVVADQGAQIRQEILGQQHEPREMDTECFEGSSVEGVHKPSGGAPLAQPDPAACR